MRSIYLISILYFILDFHSGCSQKKYRKLSIENDSLKVTIQIEEPITINNDSSKYWTIKGLIKIENKRAIITKYNNGITNLKINDKYIARCYVQTMASLLVDYGFIDLKPFEKKEYKVYWKFDENIEKIDKLDLIYFVWWDTNR